MNIDSDIFNPDRIKNWFECGVFSSLVSFNTSKGVIDPLHLDQILFTCQDKCGALHPYEEQCRNYCKHYHTHLKEAWSFAAEKCPYGDEKCCREASGHNDFAYSYCRKKPTFGPSSFSMMIMIVFFSIYLILSQNVA